MRCFEVRFAFKVVIGEYQNRVSVGHAGGGQNHPVAGGVGLLNIHQHQLSEVKIAAFYRQVAVVFHDGHPTAFAHGYGAVVTALKSHAAFQGAGV